VSELVASLVSFFAYFAGAIAFSAAFCLIYTWLTPHREFALIVREHNASAAIAFGGSLIGFAIALAGAIHNSETLLEFAIWGLVAVVTQIVAYPLGAPSLTQFHRGKGGKPQTSIGLVQRKHRTRHVEF